MKKIILLILILATYQQSYSKPDKQLSAYISYLDSLIQYYTDVKDINNTLFKLKPINDYDSFNVVYKKLGGRNDGLKKLKNGKIISKLDNRPQVLIFRKEFRVSSTMTIGTSVYCSIPVYPKIKVAYNTNNLKAKKTVIPNSLVNKPKNDTITTIHTKIMEWYHNDELMKSNQSQFASKQVIQR